MGGNGNAVNVNIGLKQADFDSLPSLEDRSAATDSNDAHSLFLEYNVDESSTILDVDEQFNITELEYDEDEYEYIDEDEPDVFESYWDVYDSGQDNEISVTVGNNP